MVFRIYGNIYNEKSLSKVNQSTKNKKISLKINKINELQCDINLSVWQWMLEDFIKDEKKRGINRNSFLQKDTGNNMDEALKQRRK